MIRTSSKVKDVAANEVVNESECVGTCVRMWPVQGHRQVGFIMGIPVATPFASKQVQEHPNRPRNEGDIV